MRAAGGRPPHLRDVSAAFGAPGHPGKMDTVHAAAQWTGVDEVSHPVQANCRNSEGLGQVPGSAVIAQEHVASVQQRRQDSKSEPAGHGNDPVRPGGLHDLARQSPFVRATDDQHAATIGGTRRGDLTETFSRPAASGIRGPRMNGYNGGRRAVIGALQQLVDLGRALVRHLKAGFEPDRRSSGQACHFQAAKRLVLVIGVREGALQRRGIRRPRAHSVTGPQPQQERIGKSSPTVQLDRQVEFLALHGHEKVLGRCAVLGSRPDPLRFWQDPHVVYRARGATEKLGMAGRSEERNGCAGVGCRKGGDGGKGKQKVAQSPAPQYCDAGDIRKLLKNRTDSPAGDTGPSEFRREVFQNVVLSVRCSSGGLTLSPGSVVWLAAPLSLVRKSPVEAGVPGDAMPCGKVCEGGPDGVLEYVGASSAGRGAVVSAPTHCVAFHWEGSICQR